MVRQLTQNRFLWLVLGVFCGVFMSVFWGPKKVEAIAVDRSDKFAMATCDVTLGNVLQGVFVLDFLTGRLSGGVLTDKSGKFQYAYYRNLALDFQLDPNVEAQYSIVSGRITLPHRGRAQPASGVIYVAELNSGRVIAYTFPYRQSTQVIPPIELSILDSFQFREAVVE